MGNNQSGISIAGKEMRNKDSAVSLGCMFILFSLLLGCATDYPKEVYRGYFGIEPSENELATLDLGATSEAIIDDMYYVSRAKHNTIKLPAGAHKIQWACTFGVSVLVEPAGYASFGIISKVHLEAGHTYRLSADRTTGHGYRVFMWIEDMTTGEIVYGEKKP